MHVFDCRRPHGSSSSSSSADPDKTPVAYQQPDLLTVGGYHMAGMSPTYTDTPIPTTVNPTSYCTDD